MMHEAARTVVHLCLLCLVALGVSLVTSDKAAAEPAKPADVKKTEKVDSRDLRPFFKRWGLKARAQGDRDTCSVFTMTGAIEYALAKQGRRGPRLSIEFLNWASNQVTKIPEDGSYFSDLWKAFEKYGACPEAAMPYQSKFDPKLRPSDKALDDAKPLHKAGLRMHWIKRWDPTKGANRRQLEEIKRALRKGWPVCGGFLWPKKGLDQWTDGILKILPREQMRDGHSVLLVGFRDDPKQPGGGVFLIRNSSKGAGDGALTYEYIRTYLNDAVWIEPTGRPGFRRKEVASGK